MSTGTSFLPPAGWYPDPELGPAARWWDGLNWTAHLLEPDQTEPVLPEPMQPARPELARPEPMQPMQPNLPEPQSPSRLPVNTASVWWLATLPAWVTIIEVGLVLVFGDLYTPIARALGALAIIFLAAALTIRDRTTLLGGGHQSAAAAWWFLMTPLAYLIARAIHVRRATGHGWAPAIVWTVSLTLPFCVVFLGALLVSMVLELI